MKAFTWMRGLAMVGVVASTLAMGGCAHSLASWIVSTRDHQGTRSLEALHFKDAAHAFQLALKIDPEDVRAREGYVEAQSDVAETFYQASQFQEAMAALEEAAKVDPQSVRVAGLRADITNAQTKSSLVHSNYPAYKATDDALIHGYAGLRANETEIIYRLKRFGYTYDTADLTRAIHASMDLESDVSKLTLRLNALRSLASAGTIAPESGTGGAASLLPIP